MGHTKGPVIADDGFKVGTLSSNTEVINSASKLLGAQLLDGSVAPAALADEAGMAKSIAATTSTGAITAGKLVTINGLSTVTGYTSNYEVVLAKNNDTALPAQFVVTKASTGANGPCEIAGVATVSVNNHTSHAVNTPLYLHTAGDLTNTKPTLKANMNQKVGVVTNQSTTAGEVKFFPAYSKVICQSS